MNILAVGDIVGDAGTEMFLSCIEDVKRQYAIDFCIVNGEMPARATASAEKRQNFCSMAALMY